jgi:micrococcal nuclease
MYEYQQNMKKMLVSLFLLIILALFASSTTSAAELLEKIKVRRVVDGDTIEVVYQGKKEHVRLIGVNTPETKHLTKGVQPYGPEASDFTTKALAGRDVWLEFDVELRDQYGRLLAYVWLVEPKGEADDKQIRERMFNARLLLDGYAQQMTFPRTVRYDDYFSVSQAEARQAGRGLWGQDSGNKTSSPDKTTNIEIEYVGNKKQSCVSSPFLRRSRDNEREKPYNHREPRKSHRRRFQAMPHV